MTAEEKSANIRYGCGRRRAGVYTTACGEKNESANCGPGRLQKWKGQGKSAKQGAVVHLCETRKRWTAGRRDCRDRHTQRVQEAHTAVRGNHHR